MRRRFDLVVLLGGADEREVVRGLLEHRLKSLGLRPVTVRYSVHPRRDPGCYNESPALLEVYRNQCNHALVVFDREGSGQEESTAMEIEADLRGRLERSGWGRRAEVVVIDPELENWVWANSPHVPEILGWPSDLNHLKSWLVDRGFWKAPHGKPHRPKDAVQATLEHVRKPRSPSLYGALSRRVGLRHCEDAAFRRFVAILRRWFLAGGVRGP